MNKIIAIMSNISLLALIYLANNGECDIEGA